MSGIYHCGWWLQVIPISYFLVYLGKLKVLIAFYAPFFLSTNTLASQGAAVSHRAIENLDQSVNDKIVGVITYGDTQKKQDSGQIPNFPPEKLLIICNDRDAVCSSLLLVLPPYLDYAKRVPEAVALLNKGCSSCLRGLGKCVSSFRVLALGVEGWHVWFVNILKVL